MKKPKVIRKVTRVHKTAGVMNGKPKVARDRNSGYQIERIKGQYPRPCEGACIWGGTIEAGVFFARLDSGVRRQVGKATVPITTDCHFSCLPRAAMLLRRFFEPLPWKATLVRGPDDESTRLFASIEEWAAWVDTHFPAMRERWDGGQVLQVGTDYYWCALSPRENRG